MKKISNLKHRLGAAFLMLAVFSGTFFLSGCGQSNPLQGYKISLEIWGLNDESEAYSKIISEYKQKNPHISEIKYRKLTYDTYKQDILDALASSNGPDIFLINNNWLPSFSDKLEPAKETMIGESDIQTQFVDVVANDFVKDKQVYAVPMALGSLALYYNKDLLNAAGIASAPKNWNEFIDDAIKLTRLDENGNIVQSGAAFGTAYNVNRSVDILSVLMLQNGVSMVDNERTYAKFDQGSVRPDGKVSNSGEASLQFYTQFARVGMPSYTWNSRMHYSIDAFSEGNLAMMINYPWHISTIKSKNAKLNFGIAQLPQTDSNNPVNYADYWGYAVAKNKVSYDVSGSSDQSQQQQLPNEIRTHEAWEFIKFMTLKNNGMIQLQNAATGVSGQFPVSIDPAAEYIKNTRQVAARKDLLETQKNDVFFGPFAYGNFIAKSWYQVSPEQVEGYFAEMIDSVNKGSSSIRDAVVLAASKVSQSMRAQR